MTPEAYYAIYNKEELVFVGNTKECSKFLEITQASFYCLVTRTRNGIIKGRKYLVYRIEEDTNSAMERK